MEPDAASSETGMVARLIRATRVRFRTDTGMTNPYTRRTVMTAPETEDCPPAPVTVEPPVGGLFVAEFLGLAGALLSLAW